MTHTALTEAIETLTGVPASESLTDGDFNIRQGVCDECRETHYIADLVIGWDSDETSAICGPCLFVMGS